ncbi:DoxX family protein [Streptomyces sp. NPDC126499]|uniref:DoxX family protein n=1 Tax=Streptomyces sp. NPDC126499 TaxID=3155314 RepID=UPI003331C3A6
MFIAYAVLAGLLALALCASAFMTFTRNPAVVDSMTKLGVPDSWLPWLAAAKAAGAVGLLAGLAVPLLGEAAAVGLVLYFAGAVVAHIRGKDYALAPAAVLTLLPAVALALRVASA